MSGNEPLRALLRLTRLSLTQFRNYEALTWRPSARIFVLHGPNGSGKTNLLEALSLLVPGRGLRGARHAELARYGPGTTGAWAVAAQFDTPDGPLAIGTGTPPGATDRRAFLLDGKPPRSQAEILSRLAALWLTPGMDRLFLEAAASRRRFLDRLVWALQPGHTRELAAHDQAVAQRNRLLADGRDEPAWLDGLEDAIARHAVAVTAARLAAASALTDALADGAASPFPAARIGLVCPVADRLRVSPALAVEDWLRTALAASRGEDRRTGGTGYGAHRADMALADAATGTPAARASTGQQKALLVSVILGHATLVTALRGIGPLLLLDEPLVHLDRERRAALLAALIRLPCTALLTGVDAEVFAPLGDRAEWLRTGGGQLTPHNLLHAPRYGPETL
ncbi:MAG: DNA replication/repair protein RecF [Acetobacteraceae bacterium]|nr:DNA replication/repair protein RecF [Acetobacteraceae bacterium]